MKLNEIWIRDPFIVLENGKYYLYGTDGANCWGGRHGFDVFTSDNLVDWDGPHPIFRPSEDFWGEHSFWAPEVHKYNGKYYLFATYFSEERKRGTQIMVSDSLMGPFEPISDGPQTPEGWLSLDGTLMIDTDGSPWMVFCHEWLQVTDGEMCAVPLSDDLSRAISDPIVLFRASEAPWERSIDGGGIIGHVTDGPYMYRKSDGELLMLWSSYGEGGYTLGIASSASGGVKGPWVHKEKPLFSLDGGHGMIFKTIEGELMLTLHTPNAFGAERPVFFKLKESDENGLEVEQ